MSSIVLERVSDVRAPCKEDQAMKIVKNGIALSMGGGLIPVPLIDLVGIAGAQSQMLCQLSELYGTPYAEHLAKNIIATLIGSLGTGLLATGVVASVVKSVPFVGSMAGIVSLPIVAGASTFALGKVFIHHFEAGGTLLDFDPDKTKAYFAKQFAEGKLVAGEMTESAVAPSPSAKSAEEVAQKPSPAPPSEPASQGRFATSTSVEPSSSSPSSVASSPRYSSAADLSPGASTSPSPSAAARRKASRGRTKKRSGSKSSPRA